jgi:hypothetical protein
MNATTPPSYIANDGFAAFFLFREYRFSLYKIDSVA